MRRSRKGSMELGVNAIVILIIALAILGLGIAFITNLFRSGSDKLGSIIDNTELPIHADAVNPIAFEKQSIEIKKGKKINLKISVYNDGTLSAGGGEVVLDMNSCRDSDNNDAGGGFTFAAPGQNIAPGSDAGYLAIITASTAEAGSYVCTVTATGDSTVSRQLIVDVIL